MSDECLFCGIVNGSVPATKVAENETTLAFMDIHPGTDGHLLVVPKRHSRDLLEISAEDLTAVTLSAQRVARAVVDVLGADGVNLLNCCGADAWQTVFHFHLHVVPRYVDTSKDSLVLPWRPGIRGDADEITRIGAILGAALR
ncbi:HIT family protein [Rhodococcus sp. 27YEA15]|uniref:HIT family protein n=1 Tax=Rhodococcus sp. 27YEA15 TaxID=3156259 RepID=UPI003C7BCA09